MIVAVHGVGSGVLGLGAPFELVRGINAGIIEEGAE
jgi:hypothetical protein